MATPPDTRHDAAPLPALPPEFAHLPGATPFETDHGLTALYGPDWNQDPLRETL